MNSCWFLVFLCAATSAALTCEKNYDDLKILHVIFRHGDRTPVNFDYPNNPYRNVTFPRGYGELTLTGKRRSYELGRSLACRYEEILKHPYNQILKATSSEVIRTRETLLAVLAGMFPPSKKEKITPFLNWQPISTDYLRFSEDNMLVVHVKCPKIFDYKDTLDSMDPKMRKIIKEIEEKSGIKLNNYATTLFIRDYIQIMSDMGYEIPAWAKPYWPEPFKMFTNLGWHEIYDANFALIIGNLLNKIAEDSLQPLEAKDRKVYMYSGHDVNVGGFLTALGAFKDQAVNYCAYVAVEVTEVAGKRSVSVYYDNHDDETPTYLEIPGCGWSCPLEKFVEFAKMFYFGDKWCT